MALEGRVITNGYKGRCIVLEWTATQNIEKNISSIKWTIKGGNKEGTHPSTYYYTRHIKAIIDGKVVYKQGDDAIKLENNKVVSSGNLIINHSPDGTKDFSISVEGAIFDYGVNCSGSANFSLNQIPRSAKITSAPNFKDTSTSLTINYDNPGKNNVKSLQGGIFFQRSGGVNDTLVSYQNLSKIGKSHTFTLSSAQQKKIQDYFTTTSKGTVYFYVKTTYSDTQVYYHSVERTVEIENGGVSVSPSIVVSDAMTKALTGRTDTIIPGYSQVDYNINAVGYKGNTIVEVKAYNGKNNYQSTASGSFKGVSNDDFMFSARGKRQGSYASKSLTLKTVNGYTTPSCNAQSTAPTPDGTATVTISGFCYKGSFGVTENTLSLSYKMKKGEELWGEAVVIPNDQITWNNNKYKAIIKFTDLDYREVYTLQGFAQDSVGNFLHMTSRSTNVRLKTLPVFDWSKDDFNLNVPLFLLGNEVGLPFIEDLTDGWQILKYSNGLAIGWKNNTFTANIKNKYGASFYENYNITLPANYFKNIINIQLEPVSTYGIVQGAIGSYNTSKINYALSSPVSKEYDVNIQTMVIGFWK